MFVNTDDKFIVDNESCHIRISRTECLNDMLFFKVDESEEWMKYEIGYGDNTEINFLENGNIESNLLCFIEESKSITKIKNLIVKIFTEFRNDDSLLSIYYNGVETEFTSLNNKGGKKLEYREAAIMEDIPIDENVLIKEFSDSSKFQSTYEKNVNTLCKEVLIVNDPSVRTRNKHIYVIEELKSSDKKYLKRNAELIIYVVAETDDWNFKDRNTLLCLCKEYKIHVVRGIFKAGIIKLGNVYEFNDISGPVSIISMNRFTMDIREKCVREVVNLDYRYPNVMYNFKRLLNDFFTKIIVIDHFIDDSVVDYTPGYEFRPEIQTRELTNVARMVKSNVVKKPVIVKTNFPEIAKMFSECGVFVVTSYSNLDKLIKIFMKILIKNKIFKFKTVQEESKEYGEFINQLSNLKL